MLPAHARLKRRSDFRQTLRRGPSSFRVATRRLVVHVRYAENRVDPTHHAEPARIGFAVSRAVGNAVVRNRVKRRLRSSVLEQLGMFPAGMRVVVRALPSAATASWPALRADVRNGLRAAMRQAVSGGKRGSS